MKTFISFLILCLIATCNAEQRTWTAVNGKEVEAEFFSNSDGQVSLKMKTGKVFRVPLDKLSKEDQDFIASISLLRSLKDNIVGKIITLEVQGNKTQTILSINGKVLSGINYDLKDINQTYEIIGNNVKLYAGISATPIVVMSFSSSNPKPADKIELKIIDNNASIAGKIIDIEHRAETKSVEEAPLNPNLKYEIKDGTVTITGCDRKASGALTITSIIEGKPVTSIREKAFTGCTSLTSIMIPDSVTSIENAVFAGCASLSSITIGDGVTSIGDSAFYSCTSLKSITIPDSVTSIGNTFFAGCTSLRSITIGDGVTSIGEKAFYSCTGLTSVTIPDSVTSIGESAFHACTSLTSITIPEGVPYIASGAFFQCTNLKSVMIGNGITSISKYAFVSCTNLTAVTFLGDAPKEGLEIFKKSSPTIYRKSEAKGWSDTFAGRPVKLISEKP